jgi:hypothetical protein
MMAYGSGLTSSGLTGLAVPNGKIVASVAANALTVAIKNKDGNDPTPGSPLFAATRTDPTTGASFEGRHITTGLSVSMSAGWTYSQSNGVPFRLWLLLVDDSLMFRLALIACYAGSGFIYPLVESDLISSNAVNPAVGIYHSDVAVSSRPFRIVGYLEWSSGLPTAGQWSIGPDIIQMFGYGIKKPSDVVQEQVTTDPTTFSTPNTIPYDDTIPQYSGTEGDLLQSSILTPRSTCNVIDNSYDLNVSGSAASTAILALFLNGGADAIATGWADVRAADAAVQLRCRHNGQARTLSTMTFSWKGGCSTGTFYVNRISGGRKLGGTLLSYKRVAEIMV